MDLQRTEQWHADRLGKVTASRISDVMAKGRSGAPSATRANYLAELVSERLTGVPYQGFQSAVMQRGTEEEDNAIRLYAFMRDADVVEVGFIPHPTISDAGASPDRLVGADGLAEFKCPNTATHIKTLRGGKIDRTYRLQMQWQMECTGRAWCDFVSYDPRLPPEMALHVERVERDDEEVAEVREAVTAFLAEVSEAVADLRDRFPGFSEAA